MTRANSRSSAARAASAARLARDVVAALHFLEEMRHLRVRHRLAGLVGQQVLLRDIGDVGGLRVLGQQVIEWLVAARTDLLGDRRQPLLGVGEHRIDVEDHAAEWINSVLHHLPDGELGRAHRQAAYHRPGSSVATISMTKVLADGRASNALRGAESPRSMGSTQDTRQYSLPALAVAVRRPPATCRIDVGDRLWTLAQLGLADGLKVRFWGVRGSISCAGAEYARYGGNTSCLEVTRGRPAADLRRRHRHPPARAGAGARMAPLDIDIYFTHTHLDHICRASPSSRRCSTSAIRCGCGRAISRRPTR